MLETVLQTIKTHNMTRKGCVVLCAVSGGADSVALLRALLALREQLGVTVCACHLNHMLRGDEAMRDEEFVRALCAEWNVPLQVSRIDVHACAQTNGLGLEEAGRNARYTFFAQAAERMNADRIATAHTLDDNLETMLFYLARGTGAHGLCGIPPARGKIIRPLLGSTRVQVESYLYTLSQPYVNDSSNASADYTRNRIRREVVPVLREINPRAAEAAGRTAALLRQDEGYLTAAADALYRKLATETAEGIFLDCAGILSAPQALCGRVLRYALQQAGMSMRACTAALIGQLIALAGNDKPSATLHLPGDLTATRQYDKLLLGEPEEAVAPVRFPLCVGECVSLWDEVTQLTVLSHTDAQDFNKSFNTFYVDCGKIDFDTLCVRTRQVGDALRLTENGGHRTLKRLMIDQKIPRAQRDRLGVIADRNGVIAVQSLGADCDRKPAGGAVLEIRFEGKKNEE